MKASDRRNESLAGGQVKGAMVRAHLQWVREHFGDAGVVRALSLLPPAAAVEMNGVLASTWCKFENLILLDRAIAGVAGRKEEDLMRELGAHSAEINLSTVYRAFRRDDIHEFFRRSAALHTQFQNFSSSAYEQIDKLQGRMTIGDATCYSPLYCASAIGYYERVIAMHGGKDPVVTETTCRCAGDPACTFELRWH